MKTEIETESLALSPEQAAKALSLGRTKIFALLRAGELKALKIGARTLIRRVDLEAFLERAAQNAA
jgi:putative molybdopterin biosynthesis protein